MCVKCNPVKSSLKTMKISRMVALRPAEEEDKGFSSGTGVCGAELDFVRSGL